MKDKREKEEYIDYDELKIENRMLNRKIKLLEKELEKWRGVVRKPIDIDRELNIFVTGIVHSCRNELILINSTVTQIQQNANILDSNLNKALDTIQRSSHLSEILLGTLSDYLGYGEIVLKAISFSEVLNEMLPLISGRLPNNITLEIHAEDNELKILANRDQLKQIILNLVNNSIWAMRDEEKGLLKISCQPMSNETDYLRIEFSDNGIGIPKENIDRVFDLNFSTKRSGWGLGLYLTKLLINRYGGSITIASEENKGTQVIIKIPVYKQQ